MKVKYQNKLKLILFSLLLFSTVEGYSQYNDYMLLTGGEALVGFQMDTTDNWWAITAPFIGKYRLIVNGNMTEVYDDISAPVFSPDGSRWACYGKYFDTWSLLTNDEEIELSATNYGEITFSADSKVMAFSYFMNDLEIIEFNDRFIEVMYRRGKMFLNQDGTKLAFMGQRGSNYVLNINGEETEMYEGIIPLGFWHDGDFMFAAGFGNAWVLYKGEDEYSSVYDRITDAKMNLSGTVAAFTAVQNMNHHVCVTISDDYYDPIISRIYDSIYGLTLHPSEPLVAFNASKELVNYVVLNNTEYFGGEYTSSPRFSFDGSELYFVGCDIDCFVNINGKKHIMYGDMSVRKPYALKPGSNTIAYTSSSTLVIKWLGMNNFELGKMMDYIQDVRYNWRDKRYEALGRVMDRLYMLTFEF